MERESSIGLGVGVGLAGAGGAAFSPEALTLFSAMTTPPSAPRKAAINDLIVTLKTAGVYSKLDVLQVHAAADAQAAALNWINPGSGPTATLVSAPTFTADKGWLPNGTSSYVNTQANVSTLAHMLANTGMHGVWSNTGARSGGTNRGAWGPGPTPRAGVSLGILAASPDAVSYQATQASNYATSNWNVPSTGVRIGGSTCAVQRTDANTLELWSGGVLRATNAANSSVGSLPNFGYYLGALNNAGSATNFDAWSHGAFFAGDVLTAPQHTALHAAFTTYMTAIGNVTTPLVGWGDSLSNGTWYTGAEQQSDTSGRAFRVCVSQGNSGENTSSITARMLADTTYNNSIQVIWAGRNDINNTTQVVDSASVKAGVASMVAAAQARSNKWLVISVTNGNLNGPGGGAQLTNSEATGTAIWTGVTTLNSELLTLYGTNFLDIRSLLVAQGLLGDANDQADAAADVPPRSYMLDDVHFNSSIGTLYIGKQIELKLQALGY